jgi:hypothetical protein
MKKEMSIKDLLEEINKKVFQIYFEDNPIRRGWEFHKIEPQGFTIRDNPEWYDNYYLLACYSNTLTEAESDLLDGYADGLIQKAFDNFMTGRTSLSEQINTSMSDWEERFIFDLKIIDGAMVKRDTFIKANGSMD